MWDGHGPLSFITSIDCARLPTAALDIDLPTAGTLLVFYFDGQLDDGSALVLAEDRESRAGARVLYMAADEEVAERRAPAGLKPYPAVPLAARVEMTATEHWHPSVRAVFAPDAPLGNRYVAHGNRLVLLGDLLRLAASGPAGAVSLADRVTALGGVWEESAAEYLTRRAIGSNLPRLLSRWEDEDDAVRFALAALAALCGTHDQCVLSGLEALRAPASSSRADVVSLMAALLHGDRESLVPALDGRAPWGLAL